MGVGVRGRGRARKPVRRCTTRPVSRRAPFGGRPATSGLAPAGTAFPAVGSWSHLQVGTLTLSPRHPYWQWRHRRRADQARMPTPNRFIGRSAPRLVSSSASRRVQAPSQSVSPFGRPAGRVTRPPRCISGARVFAAGKTAAMCRQSFKDFGHLLLHVAAAVAAVVAVAQRATVRRRSGIRQSIRSPRACSARQST